MWTFSYPTILFCLTPQIFTVLGFTRFLAPSEILQTLQCSGEDSMVT